MAYVSPLAWCVPRETTQCKLKRRNKRGWLSSSQHVRQLLSRRYTDCIGPKHAEVLEMFVLKVFRSLLRRGNAGVYILLLDLYLVKSQKKYNDFLGSVSITESTERYQKT